MVEITPIYVDYETFVVCLFRMFVFLKSTEQIEALLVLPGTKTAQSAPYFAGSIALQLFSGDHRVQPTVCRNALHSALCANIDWADAVLRNLLKI